ncbi:hypothetical protein [Methylosinus sp. Sm6]|uniref:hypothetical protein n=1 Tax=Methylosinus sp. Sm6 TaxID=2866948 RepID=UPI001C99E98B|nr:hypothetical protein [Methylosinus sp. Sm6]MBY6239856.1 hypothetical protein [Methylosinus sp. Sm6]
MKSDLVDLTMQLHHETPKAILVSDAGDRDKAVWLPKSHVEFERKKQGVVVVTLPEWMAIEKKLL